MTLRRGVAEALQRLVSGSKQVTAELGCKAEKKTRTRQKRARGWFRHAEDQEGWSVAGKARWQEEDGRG